MKRFKNPIKNLHMTLCGVALTLLLLLSGQSFSQEKRAEKTEVTKSAVVSFSTIEAYSRLHPTDPNERRLADRKDKEAEEEEEGKIPKRKVPRNSVIMQDPYGKIQPQADRPNPGTNSSSSFSPIIDFNGIDDVQSVIPPDVGGQVGPNHVMTTLNSFVRISNRTGGVLSTVTLNAFFSSLGSPSTFDPKLLYDPYNNRWIITACGNAQSATSSILVGVSQTNDPTGTWNLYKVDADAANVNWFDYPSIGFNKNWIVIGGNMFSNSGNSYAGGKVFVFKKSDLYAAVGAPGVTVINAGSNGFTLVPAVTYDNAISTMYLTQDFNGNSGGNGFIGFYTITGAIGSEVLSGTTFVSTPNPWAGGASVTNFAPQAGTASKVACNDSRMQKTIYRNGSIWCTHTVFLPAASPTRSAVQWWQLSTGAVVQQRGRIDDATATNFYAFPSIDVNKNNDAMIGCAKFNASIFPSGCYALRMATDAANTFQADFVYKAGQAKYFKTFSGTSNRWGDYTSVSVDPTNDMNFWTVQEYAKLPASGNDLWGTWWAGVCTPPPTPGNITGVTPANAGATGQVFSIAAVSGASGYTWTVPAGSTITAGQNTTSITVTLGTTSGNVTVIANNGTCSSAAQTFALTINNTPPLTATVTNNGPLCSGGTLNLSATPAGGVPPYTYSWTGPNSFTSFVQNPSIINAGTANGGTYTVVISDNAVPIVSITKTTIVTVKVTPSASITPAGPISVCSDNTPVILTAVSNAVSPSYLWMLNGVAISPAQTGSTLAASQSGSYTVVITSNGCSAVSAPFMLTVLQTSTTSTNAAACGSFTWNGVTYTNTGTYSDTSTNSVGCDSIAFLHLTISSITTSVTKTNVTCFNTATGTITVTATGGVTPYMYRLGTTGVYQSSNTFSVKAGSYKVYVLDAIGCTAITATVSITQPVAVSSTFTKTDATCYGTYTGSLTVTAINGVPPYSYRLGTTGSYGSANTFNNLKAGPYRVYILDANGCAATSASIVISQPVAVTSTFSKTDATCFGSSTGSLTVTAANGTPPYTYRLGTTGVYGNANTFNNLKAGTYRVYILDSNGCAATSASIVIGQPVAVSATYTATPATCYGTATGSLTVNGINGTPPYQYKFGSAGVYSSTNTFTNIKGGSYSIYILDANGCTGSKVAVVGQPASIVLSYTKVDITCTTPTGSITLTKTGGPSNPPYTYKLNTMTVYGSNNVFTGLRAGNYIGYIQDSLGCIAKTASIPLTAPACFGETSVARNGKAEKTNTSLELSLKPNPSAGRFTLIAYSKTMQPLTVRVSDVNGRNVYQAKGLPKQSFNFGDNLVDGVYMVEVRQGNTVKTIEAIKER